MLATTASDKETTQMILIWCTCGNVVLLTAMNKTKQNNYQQIELIAYKHQPCHTCDCKSSLLKCPDWYQ